MLTTIVVLLACGGCATGGFEDKQEFTDAYITKHGFIAVAFWRLPDGTIRVRSWGDKDVPNDFLVEHWKKFATKLAKGGSFEGTPTIETYHYTQGYSLLEPYAMGADRVGKRAEGVIRIIPSKT